MWRFGTPAPGARRTVRGSVVVGAGTPGVKRNLALATAENAQLVADRADTRGHRRANGAELHGLGEAGASTAASIVQSERMTSLSYESSATPSLAGHAAEVCEHDRSA